MVGEDFGSGGRTRTDDPRLMNPLLGSRPACPTKTSGEGKGVLAQHLSRAPENDPDLATVIAAWPSLPEPIKAGIVAMVNAAQKNQ